MQGQVVAGTDVLVKRVRDPQALQQDLLATDIGKHFPIEVHIKDVWILSLLLLFNFSKPTLPKNVPDLEYLFRSIENHASLEILFWESDQITARCLVSDEAVQRLVIRHVCQTVAEE